MNNRLIAFASLLLGAASFVSCIDPDQTDDAIFLEDKQEIETYLANNPMSGVKEFEDVGQGIYMFWEVSVDTDFNDEIFKLDTVRVDYTGSFLDNKVFDTSIEQVAKDNGVYNPKRVYGPYKFPLSSPTQGAIRGFEFAISLMRVGEKATVIFPSSLGYGSNPPQGIPINSPLMFEIELFQVTKGPNHPQP